jgi:hypothetical protein
MTTRTIGIREFRQNLPQIAKKARRERISYIVMRHQTPVGRFEPIDEDELILEKYAGQIEEGLKDAEARNTISSAELRKKLSL